jgi:hypothetical protein
MLIDLSPLPRNFRSFLLCCLLLFWSSCKESSQPNVPVSSGKRDFVWTLDTLAYPGNFQTNMQSMFGTSPSNVYVVGHSDTRNGKMYHYDGTRWRPVSLESIRITDLYAIHGTGPGDIWAVGVEAFIDTATSRIVDSSMVIHFDGARWSKSGPGIGRALNCVWAIAPNCVWTAGDKGIIHGFDGIHWRTYYVGSRFFFTSIAGISPSEIYAIGYANDTAPPIDSTGSYLFRFNGQEWQLRDSIMRTPGATPAQFGGSVYAWNGTTYTIGPNVYRRSGNDWTKLVDAEVGHMSQSSDQEIIAVGRGVFNFNGIDWMQYNQFYGWPTIWFDCYSVADQAFVVGNDNYKTIVLHGK